MMRAPQRNISPRRHGGTENDGLRLTDLQRPSAYGRCCAKLGDLLRRSCTPLASHEPARCDEVQAFLT